MVPNSSEIGPLLEFRASWRFLIYVFSHFVVWSSNLLKLTGRFNFGIARGGKRLLLCLYSGLVMRLKLNFSLRPLGKYWERSF